MLKNNNNEYYIFKKHNTSNGYKLLIKQKYIFFLKYKIKKLNFFKKWNASQNSKGTRIINTKKSLKIKLIKNKINYSYRFLKLGFIVNIVILPITLKVISLFYLSNGLVTYIPSTSNMKIFTLIKLYTNHINITSFFNKINSLNPNLFIKQGFFLIKQLPKNKNICLLEIYPNKGIQYIRSSGTFTKIIKINYKFNTALVILPSGVKKFFSIFSIGFLGNNNLSEKKNFKNNKAGFNKNAGRKSIVRGVAKNPIDHPHGGRTKAIKYPRTPWGKTTKFK